MSPEWKTYRESAVSRDWLQMEMGTGEPEEQLNLEKLVGVIVWYAFEFYHSWLEV